MKKDLSKFMEINKVMKTTIWVILLLIAASATAQSEVEIRNHYQDINKKITESKEQGYEGSLYCNEWVANKNGKSWPAVGIYQETVQFWYDDDPNHLPASERNPKNVLMKVNISGKASALTTNEEYLFQNGKLVFYFRHEGEEGNEWETRVYYNNKGSSFKSSVKANGKELTAKDFLTDEYRNFKPKPLSIMAEGRKLQELFIKSM